jgi:hypothetical protein
MKVKNLENVFKMPRISVMTYGVQISGMECWVGKRMFGMP